MDKIPTAEEFIMQCLGSESKVKQWERRLSGNSIADYGNVLTMLDEYSNLKAKLHVEAALKAAAKNCRLKVPEDRDTHALFVIDRQSILNAYPLTNVK